LSFAASFVASIIKDQNVQISNKRGEYKTTRAENKALVVRKYILRDLK